MYLFGFSNSFAFGEKYVVAITYATLVTDLQWDVAEAIKTVAKIDIVKNKFDYAYHFRNAVKLILILIFTVLLMSVSLYQIYKPDILTISIFISLHIVDFITVSQIYIKMCYLEIEYSPAKTTANNIIAIYDKNYSLPSANTILYNNRANVFNDIRIFICNNRV